MSQNGNAGTVTLKRSVNHVTLILVVLAVVTIAFFPRILSAQVSPLTLQPATGNVGIGTATPVYALSVYRGASGTTSNVETGVNGAVAQTRFAGLTDGAATRVWGSGLNITNGNGGYELYDYTAGASRFYINTSGNVGIGTINPTSLLEVNGTFSATTKNFQIDHPLEPTKKFLVHSSLEGPEVAVYYRGEAELQNGEAIIDLPAYFEALTRKEQRTVQLTPIGGWAPLYVEDGVKDGRFTVKAANTANSVPRFYWEVKAVRADVAPLIVEKSKEESQTIAQNLNLNYQPK
jgi:hypothetical protein